MFNFLAVHFWKVFAVCTLLIFAGMFQQMKEMFFFYIAEKFASNIKSNGIEDIFEFLDEE